MKRGSSPSDQKGFTIVELMIATAVFATVLLVCTMGLLQVGRTYYKGVTAARTQEAARLIMDEITQTIQFGSGDLITPLQPPATDDGSEGFCIGGKRFSYILDRQLVSPPATPGPDQAAHVIVVDELGACGAATRAQNVTGSPVGREILNTRMRITHLDVAQLTGELYRVSIKVVSGDTDVLVNPTHDACANARAGTQFCAVSELRTVVHKRVM